MLRTSHTPVVERFGQQRGSDAVSSEPYEAGWAAEARWFIRVERAEGGPWIAFTELSPDGTNWVRVDDGIRVEGAGLVTDAVTGFGSWLRLTIVPDAGASQGAELDFVLYLALKS